MLYILAVTLPFVGAVNLTGSILTIFLFCILGVVIFECVNGFHDTANAVATVIYTKTLPPYVAIVWSGICNFMGVFVIGTAVAMSLLKLVPLNTLVTLPVEVGACMVIAILLASIIWNLGTWFFGLPLSSTHTLIGAMIGASLAFSYYYGGGVNWNEAKEIGLSLLISPIIGFGGAALLMYAIKHLVKTDKLFHAPENDDDKPPVPVRILLVTTCTLVSFFHGSNDGQKGVGLLMLVLTAFLPAVFALNPKTSERQLIQNLNAVKQTIHQLSAHNPEVKTKIFRLNQQVDDALKQSSNKTTSNVQQKFKLRRQLQSIADELNTLVKNKAEPLPEKAKKQLVTSTENLQKDTDYAPVWVLAIVSLSLGLGTMIGWKRIVVTIGERIGNEHLNYAEGASAELVAAGTIGLSTSLGLPVSTTHVLTGGVTGAMAASNGAKNVNFTTVKNIVRAWVLTLPVAIGLGLLLFAFLHLFLK